MIIWTCITLKKKKSFLPKVDSSCAERLALMSETVEPHEFPLILPFLCSNENHLLHIIHTHIGIFQLNIHPVETCTGKPLAS